MFYNGSMKLPGPTPRTHRAVFWSAVPPASWKEADFRCRQNRLGCQVCVMRFEVRWNVGQQSYHFHVIIYIFFKTWLLWLFLLWLFWLLLWSKGDMDSKRVLAFFRLQVGQSEVPFLKTWISIGTGWITGNQERGLGFGKGNPRMKFKELIPRNDGLWAIYLPSKHSIFWVSHVLPSWNFRGTVGFLDPPCCDVWTDAEVGVAVPTFTCSYGSSATVTFAGRFETWEKMWGANIQLRPTEHQKGEVFSFG